MVFIVRLPSCTGAEDLPLSSVSPPSPLLAGELPPHAPSAFAPSPRKGRGGGGAQRGNHPTTRSHAVMSDATEMKKEKVEDLQRGKQVKWRNVETVEAWNGGGMIG